MQGRCSAHGRRALDGVPIIESQFIKRGVFVTSKAGAFLDAPWLGAIIMHPVTACQVYASIDLGRPLSDVDVQFEGLRRYLDRKIRNSAAAALRRLDRMYPRWEQEGESDV
ncbi:hypothetical protein CQ047_11185 [Microbacterium sp. MYb72]|uniref:hypothetical protein n=1 Tax=Microbacterium sp. MYb72 TaxID=1848693 RepID=UPI000CFC0FB2|nr:hypothetical protein [Microbacterium sp. MYb72]PRB09237.1 hypothetical protein CQ047_11185 [Microbacterium sp. MYb72]